MADQRYYNMNSKGEDNRYKVNTNILRMMQANPTLGTGYIIGSMLGENYWGKKRAKTRQETKDKFFGNQNGSIGADANGTYGTNNSTPASTSNNKGYYDSMNEALEEYKQGNPNGKVLYSGLGSNVQTPQQANKPAVTTENAGNGGGVPTPADHWNNIMNASTYNPGSTGMYTNGARNLGNVIGADANGVYGVNSTPVIGANENGLIGVTPASSAPSVANFPQKPANGPAPYTDDQLRQIQGQNFTAEELAKMASPQELARMVVMARGGAAPATASQVAQGQPSGYAPKSTAPASDVDKIMQQAANETAATNTPIVADAVPDAANLRIHGNTGQGGGGQAFGPAPEYVDPAQNLAVSNNPYAGYGYGVDEQGLFNGSAVDRYQEYLRQLQRDASGNF